MGLSSGMSLKRINFMGFVGLLTVLAFFIISGCGEEKVVIRYLKPPQPVELIFPPVDTFITESNPTFTWHFLDGASRYQIQVSLSVNFISNSINTTTSDTVYTTVSELSNNTYFWRVRAQNADTLWGDWSDAEIRSFYKSDYVDYITPLSSITTYGICQDVYVRGDTAYVADGQADLTIFDTLDKNNPTLIRNIDTIDDDYAYSVYIPAADTFPYAFVADLDGRVQVINTADTSFLYNYTFGEQNLRDLDAGIIDDTLYFFTIRARSGFNLASMSIYQIVYDPYPRLGDFYYINPIDMPANPYGVKWDGEYVYVACGEVGIRIINISDINAPYEYSSLILDGISYAVAVSGDYAYVAADREGLYVVNVQDKAVPFVVNQINTSGRTRDVHIVGDYAYIADGSGGLKIIDISVPDSAHFVVAYDTPYANGVWADSGYVYVCDRDEGLMIFENKVAR